MTAPTRPRKPKVRPPLERVVQHQIVAYLKAAGWSVWQTSVGHKHPSGAKGLRVTAGIPDLYCLHPRRGAIWVEVKREGGVFSPAQFAFRERHLEVDLSAIPTLPIFWVHSLAELRHFLWTHGMGARP